MDTYTSLYTRPVAGIRPFNTILHMNYSLYLGLQLLDVVTVQLSGRNSEIFGSVVIRFHGRLNSTYSITPILEITEDRQ